MLKIVKKASVRKAEQEAIKKEKRFLELLNCGVVVEPGVLNDKVYAAMKVGA